MPAIIKGFFDKVLLKQFAYVEAKQAFLGVWGVVWLVQLKAAGCGGKNYYLLGQWIMFFSARD